MKVNHWWIPLLFVLIVGATGVMLMGIRTYQDAPPIPTYVDEAGATIIPAESIVRGQSVFQRYALMDYGSFFGDGANRGPDFTADSLHRVADAMIEREARVGDPDAAVVRARRDIKRNRYDAASNTVVLGAAQVYAAERLAAHVTELFDGETAESFQPTHYIRDPDDLRDLTAFFFWGAWVCGVERPGEAYSYTHNWPFDPVAGNAPSPGVTLWSVFGALALIVALGAVLYVHGRFEKATGWHPPSTSRPLTVDALASITPSATQRATYKFFAVAILVFLLQVVAGILTVHDFVGFTHFFGVDVARPLPITVVRSWHIQLSILWIAACWVGASIFVLPTMNPVEPRGQRPLVDALFAVILVVVLGSVVGIFLGPHGLLGEHWRLLGHQGWEFVELGKVWQALLFVALVLWAIVVCRGVWPALRARDPWSIPWWLVYTVVAICVLFLSSFVATPRTNFVIGDFWRWCVIHMWAEAFFEVFTTVLVAYFLVRMGLSSIAGAKRVVYLSTLLFLGSGILGISHNFYWNAKPVITLAIGSVFSTLQVVPLVLLSLEAWKFRRLPSAHGRARDFAQSESFLFLLGVNFWNFVGAGVFGFIINLPIVNYYEHGTYLTVNHGHSALMGVYGNLSIAGVLFCCRHLVPQARWNERLVRVVFWSLNAGLALMVILDLFPAGILQLSTVLERGLWLARSQAFVQGDAFQAMTWLRAIGGAVFVVGGVAPLTWFVVSRWGDARRATAIAPAPISAPPPSGDVVCAATGESPAE